MSSFKFAGRLLRRCVRPYRTLQIPWPRPARHPRGRPAHPAREAPGRACPASEPCRARAKVNSSQQKKKSSGPVDNCLKFRRTCPAEPRQPADMEGTQLMSRTNYEAVTERRKSRSGTRSRAYRKKTDMPRHKFHANVEASIPSAPGTQLMMSRITNYEAVSGFAGHWLHRAQVSLLTGKIGQIKLSHIRKKKPWCGPGAGLVRAPRPKPRSRPRLQGRPRTVTRAETCAEEGLV